MDDDPYGLKRTANSSAASPLFTVEWRPDDTTQSLGWRWLDSWRRPALELFTRYTPEACFRRMAAVADEVNQDPEVYGFEAPLSGRFSQAYFTLRKTPPLLLDKRRLFGGLLSGRIERQPRGLHIRLWHRISAGPLIALLGLVSIPLGWIASDLLASNLPSGNLEPIVSWLVFLGISLGVWILLTAAIVLLGNRWIHDADADLLHFARKVLDDDKDFDGWPSLRSG